MKNILQEADECICRLISAIEQHHATSLCKSDATYAAAQREYAFLWKLREAKRAYLKMRGVDKALKRARYARVNNRKVSNPYNFETHQSEHEAWANEYTKVK